MQKIDPTRGDCSHYDSDSIGFGRFLLALIGFSTFCIWSDSDTKTKINNSPYCKNIATLNEIIEEEIDTKDNCKTYLQSKVSEVYNDNLFYNHDLKCKYFAFKTVPVNKITRCKEKP